jgi:hypothetical protein
VRFTGFETGAMVFLVSAAIGVWFFAGTRAAVVESPARPGGAPVYLCTVRINEAGNLCGRPARYRQTVGGVYDLFFCVDHIPNAWPDRTATAGVR